MDAAFVDLNKLHATANAKNRNEQVIILTPLKNAEPYLDRYFQLIDSLSYPKNIISIAFLVSDTADNTIKKIRKKANKLLNLENNARFRSISIYEKDFEFELPEEKRHKFELQPLRRSFMARSRNYLLVVTLKKDHSWVLWLDVDLVYYPATILEGLQSLDVDIVAPNCVRQMPDSSFSGYDKNNWQETEESLAVQKDLDPSYVLLEGYYEFLTQRHLMINMPMDHDKMEKVSLDGAGAAFILVKSNVHREGANFPSYPFQHQIETEGFAKIAKYMGFEVYGLPSYIIHHVSND